MQLNATPIPPPPPPDLVFSALADPTRRSLFERLSRQGEQTVHEMTAQAGVSQPAVSKHLNVLKAAGLVNYRREGRETHYTVEPKGLVPLMDWMSFYGIFWRGKLDQLEGVLDRME